MGTGSAGRDGSGDGASGGGSGGGPLRFESYRWNQSPPGTSAKRADKIRQEITRLLRKKSIATYLKRQLTSPLVDATYQRVWEIAFARNDPAHVRTLLGQAGVGDGPGFLGRYAVAIVRRHAGIEPAGRVVDTTRSALEDYLMLAIGNRPDVYATADLKTAASRLDDTVLASTLAHFLIRLLNAVLAREAETLSSDAMLELTHECEWRANRAIANFEAANVHTGRAGHRDFFTIVGQDPTWLLRELAP